MTGKKEIKKQMASNGEGPRKEPGKGQGECPQNRRAPSQESRCFSNLPGWKGAHRELEQIFKSQAEFIDFLEDLNII